MLLRIFPGLPLRNVLPVHRHRPIAVIAHPSTFQTAWCGAVLALVYIFYLGLEPPPSHGLVVRMASRSPRMAEASPWKDTLGVYVKSEGQFLVNGEPVKREALAGRLEKELARTMTWTVYFEADPGTPFGDSVYCIDVVQGLGAQALWITPKMREEWKAAAGWPSPAKTP